MIIDIAKHWIPTPENMNKLPEPLRDYIHELETNSSTLDLIQENAALKFLLDLMTAAIVDASRCMTDRMEKVNDEMDKHYPDDAPVERPVLTLIKGEDNVNGSN